MARRDERMSEGEEETEAESMSESESESESQSGGEKSRGGLDYIMSLPDVPMKLPPHVELQRTRVLCNADAPNHVFLSLLQILFAILYVKFFQFRNYPLFVSGSYSNFINTSYLFLGPVVVVIVVLSLSGVKFETPSNSTL